MAVAEPEVGSAARIVELERALRDKDELLERERQHRHQLEAAHVAKDRFLAVLSYDLRGPLNAVLGWTQLLRRERLDASSRDRALATIERNARTQALLVEELLDISRIADRVQLERTPLDMCELVKRAADAQAATALERGIAVHVRTTERPSLISGDRRRLERALSSLLSNALNATSRGGTITLSVASEESSVRVTVEDDGRGISPSLLPLLFDPLSQTADYATAGQVGLGLYLVRQVVEVHGGKVTAESEGPGKGARFTVLLPPLANASSSSPESSPPPVDAGAQGAA